MKSRKNSLIIFLIAFMYAIQFYINNKIAPVGDQTAFLKYAEDFKFNYLLFAVERYASWSSRLLIESATLFFSVHEKLFVLAAFGATFLFFWASRKWIPSLPWLPALLVFIFFPATEFLSAGSIPTYVNYILPASLLVFSLVYKNSKKTGLNLACLLTFAFAIMQEQLAVYAFLWLIFDLFVGKKERDYRIKDLPYLVLASLGILSAKLSPGNAIRFGKEVTSWFPNYVNLNLFQKVGLGFLETCDKILSVSFPFVIFFLLTLLVYAYYKKQLTAMSLTGFVLFNIISQKLEFNNLFKTVTEISRLARDSKVFHFNLTYLSAVVFYAVLLLMIVYSLWLLVSDVRERSWLVYLFAIGFLSRMLISLSPTLYASDTRTFLPLMMSLFIISCKLINDLLQAFEERKVKVNNAQARP